MRAVGGWPDDVNQEQYRIVSTDQDATTTERAMVMARVCVGEGGCQRFYRGLVCAEGTAAACACAGRGKNGRKKKERKERKNRCLEHQHAHLSGWGQNSLYG